MTGFSEEMPNVTFKPGNMLGGWNWIHGSRLAMVLVSLALYVYILCLLKVLYMKNERLDQLSLAVKDTEHALESLRSLDQQLAADIERLETTLAPL